MKIQYQLISLLEIKGENNFNILKKEMINIYNKECIFLDDK